MDRKVVAAGALSGFLGVAIGAFGTHALRSQLIGTSLETFRTGVDFQLIHALAIIASGMMGPPARRCAGCFLAGSALFCASLYAVALGAPRAASIAAPVGGLLMLTGWVLLAVVAVRVEVA